MHAACAVKAALSEQLSEPSWCQIRMICSTSSSTACICSIEGVMSAHLAGVPCAGLLQCSRAAPVHRIVMVVFHASPGACIERQTHEVLSCMQCIWGTVGCRK